MTKEVRAATPSAFKVGLCASALKHSGGMERYARDLARGLIALGTTPAFFARQFDASLPESQSVAQHRINVSFLPGKLRDTWFSWRVRKGRKSAGVDVLIGCCRIDSSDIAICGGTHLGLLRAVGRDPRWSDRLHIALDRAHFQNARIVVAHSDLMREELRELYGIEDEKIRLLYPPIDHERFSPAPPEERARLRARYGFADHEMVLLFPSSSHVRKGLPLIEAALQGLPPSVVIAVAGRAPERPNPRVRYLGYVQQIEACYRAADFTVLASVYEPFGLVGAESVMCGTPVILSANIGCSNAIAPHAKFVFSANDVQDLRITVERALEWRAVGAQTSPADVARGALLYDPKVSSHVDALLALAAGLSSGTQAAASGRVGMGARRAPVSLRNAHGQEPALTPGERDADTVERA